MYEIVVAGGWLMVPILLCSLVSVAIIIERFWSLSRNKILPPGLLRYVWDLYKSNQLTMDRIIELRQDSPLGEVFSVGLVNQAHGRDVMKDAMEEAGSKVAHEMERFLAALGTIAAITPLLGLLGTVLGMIEVFTEIMVSGTGDTGRLAGGISTALITTASGLTIAIPSMVFHRYFERQIDGMVVDMEHQCSRLVDAIFSGKVLSESVEEINSGQSGASLE
ncbi:MAG: MotA/TolQ/ExbB proton channel family protein [Gammaproteobacteria bacterium]